VIEKEFNVHYNMTYIWQILEKIEYSAQIPIIKAIEKNGDYMK
jgi:transposase